MSTSFPCRTLPPRPPPSLPPRTLHQRPPTLPPSLDPASTAPSPNPPYPEPPSMAPSHSSTLLPSLPLRPPPSHASIFPSSAPSPCIHLLSPTSTLPCDQKKKKKEAKDQDADGPDQHQRSPSLGEDDDLTDGLKEPDDDEKGCQRLAHDRELNRVEIFKIGRCKELPDGTEQWVDDESRSRYERMIQLSTTSLDSESGSTPISAEEAFVSVMGKDRYGRICCGGSRETRRTWYGTGEGPSSTDYQQHISNIENTLRMEVEELGTEARRRDSEMDEMRRELEQLRKRESKIDDIRRQMLQMSTFMTQFQTSQRFDASAPPRAPEDDHVDTNAEGDDYDDDDD
ncbi:hypothetical protein Taro_012978 [Colocasia esculenta]|uniref:Uncharacterized protein n=1 Tax=Colocasia esculenta TaxID=4460 RepID=A0A843UKQ7_COLES|nr:hypothetical protein [Colocasia esculenta]